MQHVGISHSILIGVVSSALLWREDLGLTCLCLDLHLCALYSIIYEFSKAFISLLMLVIPSIWVEVANVKNNQATLF